VTRLGTSVLLFAYRLFRRPLQSGPGRRVFLFAYRLYKRTEARDLPALEALVARGSTVIDVGANVGYFTRRFAAWVLPGGRVLALEPEAQNAGDLRRLAARHRWSHVECLQAAAADRSGDGRLALNPVHPADHRLSGTTGEVVELVTLDELMAARRWPAVSLIKIDVQGAELAVINGAVETIRRCRPALYVEVDDEALVAQGASARALASRLDARGYAPHAIEGTHRVAVTTDAIVQRSTAGRYTDILWLAR
jgi:FkbM family methyltransferase